MLSDILSSRGIIVGLILFLLIVVGAQWYSWDIRRSSAAEMTRTNQFLQQLGNKKEAPTVQDVGVPTNSKVLQTTETSLETDDPQNRSEETEVLLGHNVAEGVDFSEPSVDTAVAVEDVPADEEAPYGVSPHGFGPFPAVPPDYFRTAEEVWGEARLRTMLPGHELLSRVQIKLWNQGIRTFGAKFENGLVYPAYDDVVWIEWADSVAADGKMYIIRQFGAPEVLDQMDQYEDNIHKGIFPPHLTVYEPPDGGIDPYEFLGLPR